MFDEIRKDKHRKPLLTYFIALISIIVTLTTIINPEYSYTYFGSIDGGVSLLSIFTIPFQHGFDRLSALIHLIFNLSFWIVLGSFVEKVVGPKKMFTVITTIIILDSLIIFITGLPGHGISPLIYGIIPLLIATMMEVVKIKLANAYVKTFKLLKSLIGLFILISIVMFSFVPIYFKFNTNTHQITKSVGNHKNQGGIKQGVKFQTKQLSNVSLFDSELSRFIFGNFVNILSFITGFLFAYKYKKRIGGTLNKFNKHKEFAQKDYKPAYIFASVISGYILLVYITSIFY